MKLGRWGWQLKRLSLARFQRNRAMGFGDSAKKWVAEALFFCDVNHAPLLPLSLDRFPPTFPRTRVQVVSRDTWFHITESFPLMGRISRKTVFLWYFRVPCLCSAYGSREMFCDAYSFSILYWTAHRFIFPGDFCWGMCCFPAIHLRKWPFATDHSMRNWHTWMGTPGERRDTTE